MTNEILILMDDSGKLNKNENSCIFGGLFFFSNSDYINFINRYKSIINNIKCKYCKQNMQNCNKDCIEIKGTTKVSSEDSRRLFNLLKKQNNYGVFINNKDIYDNIINDKSARGRYIDYAQKRIIKEIILYAIKNKKIRLNELVYLNIKIDDAKTKSNGYYNLKDSIYEELVNGIKNYDYSARYKPVLKSGLDIKVRYYNSKYNYGIQSADIMSHYLHKQYELYLTKGRDISQTTNFIEIKLFLP
ncbi:MAG: hypothetical protein NC181_04145 [Clostridium sp.]|nr:hypothetical protein [Clostridium sp.]MCM1444462.1 hypothetical protein [Candidatus Amulumruptor caecigallinarius]